jgi:hypothetical protein
MCFIQDLHREESVDPLLQFLQSGIVKRADPNYLRGLAERNGLKFRALKAVTIVESGGRSSYDAKKRPVLLYEPHKYYELIPAGKRAEAVSQNLARARWEKSYYNRFERTADDRWRLLDRAAAFHNAEAAVGACSWGSAQILAYLWCKKCGYADASKFVKASLDEEKMLDAIVAVLLAMKLKRAINQPDFEEVARKWNGAGNIRVYAKKMRDAFNSLPP